jgi:WD40 repeat protein
VLSIAYSPDGDLVVTGHAAGDVALRRSDTFQVARRSEAAFGDGITAVAFTPDGGTVLAGGLTGTVRVFDAATLESLFAPLDGHRGVVSGVAANDRFILTTSDDGTVRMWDLAGGDAIGGPIPTGGTTFPSIALRSDGERALVQADQGLLELIVDEDEWARLACSIVGRELTGHERARLGIEASASACAAGT